MSLNNFQKSSINLGDVTATTQLKCLDLTTGKCKVNQWHVRVNFFNLFFLNNKIFIIISHNCNDITI